MGQGGFPYHVESLNYTSEMFLIPWSPVEGLGRLRPRFPTSKRMMEEADTDDGFIAVFPSETDLPWDQHVKVLTWWGEQFDGSPT